MKQRYGKFQSGILTGLVLIAAIGAGVVAFLMFDTAGTTATLGPEYVYDISDYARIDPAVIRYRQVGEPIQTGLDSATAIAADATGRIFAAGDTKVIVYSPAGDILRQSDLDGEPTCITISEDGTLAVGIDDQIILLDAQGREIRRWQVPALSPSGIILTSLAMDKDAVFAADAVGKAIRCFTRQGDLINTIGQKDPDRNIPGFVIPSPYFDVAMADDGLLRVVNPGRHLIEAYTVDGDREWVWGKSGVSVEGFSGCCNPINFALLPDGGFVTAEKGLVRIKVYDVDGEFVGVVAGPEELDWDQPQRVCQTPEECSSKGYDVAADSQGRVYVLDMVHKNIRIFEKK